MNWLQSRLSWSHLTPPKPPHHRPGLLPSRLRPGTIPTKLHGPTIGPPGAQDPSPYTPQVRGPEKILRRRHRVLPTPPQITIWNMNRMDYVLGGSSYQDLSRVQGFSRPPVFSKEPLAEWLRPESLDLPWLLGKSLLPPHSSGGLHRCRCAASKRSSSSGAKAPAQPARRRLDGGILAEKDTDTKRKTTRFDR